MAHVKTGIEILLDQRSSPVFKWRIGLITNRSAVTTDLTPSFDALLKAGVKVTALFAPEHGFTGQAADGERIESFIDEKTGIPVYSLYGTTKKPATEMLAGVDMLLFDIQDVGARFYTFLYTMAYAMEASAEAGKPFVVLDRPNPIGGISIEEPMLSPEFSSFVGFYPVPIRYGMTIGEFARMINREFGIGAELTAVPLSGWKREMWFDETGLPWVPPSPAIPTLETAAVYPGACLLEGTNVSEGRSTEMPFQTTGAPWIDSAKLADELNLAKLPGIRFDPVNFTPSSSKYAGFECSGVSWKVTDRDKFLPVMTGVKVIEIIHRLWPEEFEFRKPGPDGRYFFDLLAGTDRLRQDLESGRSAEEIAAGWKDGILEFCKVRRSYLLY
ncbi:MAG: DUF1343 domain-containing protein [Armatimonadota bacterium]